MSQLTLTSTEDAKFLDYISSQPYQVAFETSAQLKLITDHVSLEALINPIQSIAFRFRYSMSAQDLKDIVTIVSHAPNLYSLRIYQFSGPAVVFEPAFEELALPNLKFLSVINVEHSCLARFLHKHRDLDHFMFTGRGDGAHTSTSRHCPLQEVRFNRALRIYGPSVCVSGMVSKNAILGLGLMLDSARDARWPARTLTTRFGAGAGVLSFLAWEIEARDLNVIETLWKTCRGLDGLKLRIKKIPSSGRTSPRKSSGSPQKLGAGLGRLTQLKQFDYQTDEHFVDQAKNEAQEWSHVVTWLEPEGGKYHPTLREVNLCYRGIIDGRVHQVNSKWVGGPDGWERSRCRSERICFSAHE